MFNLPNDIQRHIYSFDPTYHEKYQEVLENILPIEEQVIRKFCKEYGYFVIEKDNTFYKLSNIYESMYREVITYNDLVEYTKKTLYAFEFNFIKEHLRCNLSLEAYDNLQTLEYNANEIIFCLIKDFENFIQDYIDYEVYINKRMDIITINDTDYYLKVC